MAKHYQSTYYVLPMISLLLIRITKYLLDTKTTTSSMIPSGFFHQIDRFGVLLLFILLLFDAARKTRRLSAACRRVHCVEQKSKALVCSLATNLMVWSTLTQLLLVRSLKAKLHLTPLV